MRNKNNFKLDINRHKNSIPTTPGEACIITCVVNDSGTLVPKKVQTLDEFQQAYVHMLEAIQ